MEVTQYTNVEAALNNMNGEFNIVNSSDLNRSRAKGKVTFSLISETGTRNPVYIPPTWIPIDLLTYGSEESIRRSSDLRSLHRQGLILLIDKESADQLRAHPKYNEEYEKVHKQKIEVGHLDTEKVTLNTSSETTLTSSPSTDNSNVAKMIELNKDVDITGTPSPDLISLIDSEFPTLTSSDFQYIMEKVGDRSSFLYLAAVDANGIFLEGEKVTLKALPCYIDMSKELT